MKEFLVIPLVTKINDPLLVRPFWSVMIPTYNPDEHYLTQTLKSVLGQDPGPDQMQIEVVDDCSPDVDVAALVKKISGERITVSKTPENLGIAGCWNTCIQHSLGEWVHILHQDDLVFPGFYTALQQGVNSDSRIGAAFSRFAYLDSAGNKVHVSESLSETPEILENWVTTIAVELKMECPSIVVRRSVYEEMGGFNRQYCYVLDWDMWMRIAFRHAFFHHPGILAGYRQHQYSETSKLQQSGKDTKDIKALIQNGIVYSEHPLGAELARKARINYAKRAVRISRSSLVEGNYLAVVTQTKEALKLSCNIPTIIEILSLFMLWIRLQGAKVKKAISAQ